MILLDATVLIAFFRKEDEDHAQALKLIETINESSVITTSILLEVLTVIKSRDGGIKAREAWERIKNTDIEILEILDVIEQIVYFIEKYDALSFGDASNIAVMKQFDIDKIASFDSDFDLIPGIERIH